jgi:hypothetical protein
MKKLYTVLCAAVLCAIAFSANATVNVNFVVNQSDAAYISYYDSTQSKSVTVDLVEGDNQMEMADYQYINIFPKSSDYIISNVTNSAGTYTGGSSTWYTSLPLGTDYPDGVTITVTALKFDEAADGQFTLTIDDPTKVRCTLSGLYRDMIPLVTAGQATTIKYITSSESTMTVQSATSSNIYKVTQNGQTLTASYGSYYINLANGDDIVVSVNYPDEKVKVTFEYTDPKAEGCVTGVTVNDEAVSDYANGFEAQLGATIYLSLNNNDYNIQDIYVNDSRQSYYGYSYFSFQLTDASVIKFDATKYEAFKATINIDDPDRVKVTRPSGYSTETLTLTAGDNLLDFTSGKNNTLTFTPNSGYQINSISDGTTEYFTGSSKTATVTISEGQTLTVTSGEITYDSKAVLYIDDITIANSYAYCRTPDNEYADTKSGYNLVKFNASANGFAYGFYGNTVGANYYGTVNGEALTPTSKSDTSLYFDIKYQDGDVYKIFFAGEPNKYAVTFDVDDATADKFSVTRDIIDAVANYTAGFSSYQGTQIDITTTLEDAVVTVNDVALEPSEGVYTFTVNADSVVKLADKNSSVSIIASDDDAITVYNLQGIRVLNNANAAQIKALPKGLYIVNGKKQIVK